MTRIYDDKGSIVPVTVVLAQPNHVTQVKTVETDIKLSDLKANDQVTIVGTTDANGNVAATAIVAGGNALQGLFGGQGGPGGARGASPSPSPSAKP